MTISEDGDENCFENCNLCFFRQISFHDNRILQSSHHCTRFDHSGDQFFVLPSVTRVNTTPRYLNFSTCFSDAPLTWNEHWSGFLERWSTSVLVVLIFIPALWQTAAKSFNLQYFGGQQIQWKKAKPDHLQTLSKPQTQTFCAG